MLQVRVSKLINISSLKIQLETQIVLLCSLASAAKNGKLYKLFHRHFNFFLREDWSRESKIKMVSGFVKFITDLSYFLP